MNDNDTVVHSRETDLILHEDNFFPLSVSFLLFGGDERSQGGNEYKRPQQ